MQLVRVMVSIHAPVKDATKLAQTNGATSPVSIHAPVKDATFYAVNRCAERIVSIHAPVKDATSGSSNPTISRTCFNPRAREGRD